jgi:regulator of replication initiation timing
MTLAHAPNGSDSSDERSPDSGDLRVSQKTGFESGIPPARDRLVRAAQSEAALEQLELVLVESTRAEANLGLLHRGLKHLAAGASAAQEANAVLVQELEALRGRLSKVYESESLLQQRVQTLENALEAAGRERDSWLVQEDAFLAGLLDEHEQKVFDLERNHERRLGELDLTLDELRQQRDSARSEVLRLTYERDAAVALLNEPIAHTERNPTPVPGSSSPGVALGSMKLAKQALPSKSENSGRPLVGYAVAATDVAEEHLEGSQLSTRPPGK